MCLEDGKEAGHPRLSLPGRRKDVDGPHKAGHDGFREEGRKER